MPDPRQLRSLIQLLEDPSIRPTILRELNAFGPTLEEELERQHIGLDTNAARCVRTMLDQPCRERLIRTWKQWFKRTNSKEWLEEGLQILAEFQLGRLYPVKLRSLLDRLADEYDARYTSRDTLQLAEFLFQGYSLRGADQDGYYDPLNSNLIHVIEQKRGLPISLACIYMLVGNRLGLKIEGCNFPGHFMALASTRKDTVIVDCFNGGRFIDDEALATVKAKVSREDILRLECDTTVIITRILRNMANAYHKADQDLNADTINVLLNIVEPSP